MSECRIVTLWLDLCWFITQLRTPIKIIKVIKVREDIMLAAILD